MEIIRESEFDTQIEELTGDYTRMDDLDNAIDWALEKNSINDTEVFLNIEGDYYLWVTEEFYSLDIPKVRILYKYDGNYTINLLSIERY